MPKRTFLALVFIALILLSSFSVLAFGGNLGNSRMVLRLEPKETIEKSLLVINPNDIPVKIELTPTGELADSIKLREESFTLAPQEEKKAYFTIKAPSKAGTTESKINVKFKSEDNALGLTATIIIIVADDSQAEESEEISSEENSTRSLREGFNFNLGSSETSGTSASKLSPALILSLSTILLVAVLLALYFYSSKKSPTKSKKGVNSRA